MSEKIQRHHLERKAILYVRQSTPHQVQHNRESGALQYAMRGRLEGLGFTRVETIDDDLGRSASGGAARAGFDRMVAEVCLGKVGAVAAREVSRFARNSRDWQQLIEMCRVVDTVLVDHDAVYAPRQGNDRLLLGLKGQLNEYEVDLLRQRSLAARDEKARRGELFTTVPVGFVKNGGRLEKEPDRRVQQAIALVFDKVEELGSVRQTLLWFHGHGLELPVRRPGRETVWRPAQLRYDLPHGDQPGLRRRVRVRPATDRHDLRGLRRSEEDGAQAARRVAGAQARIPRGVCGVGACRSDTRHGERQRPCGQGSPWRQACPAGGPAPLPALRAQAVDRLLGQQPRCRPVRLRPGHDPPWRTSLHRVRRRPGRQGRRRCPARGGRARCRGRGRAGGGRGGERARRRRGRVAARPGSRPLRREPRVPPVRRRRSGQPSGDRRVGSAVGGGPRAAGGGGGEARRPRDLLRGIGRNRRRDPSPRWRRTSGPCGTGRTRTPA